MELTFFHTIILGIIEGLTEFIPVSSTAHLLLTTKILGVAQTQFSETFTIAIQSGAVLALCAYFFKTIISSKTLWWKIALGCVPFVLVGLFLYPFINVLFQSFTLMGYALIIGGIGFLFIREHPEESIDRVPTLREFLILGTVQVASIIPGISRSGATLLGGSFLKIPKHVIINASFLLAIPTIFGATAYDIARNPLPSAETLPLLFIGIVTAFIVSLFCIHFFLQFLKQKPLAWFGWYRIVVGILVLLFV